MRNKALCLVLGLSVFFVLSGPVGAQGQTPQRPGDQPNLGQAPGGRAGGAGQPRGGQGRGGQAQQPRGGQAGAGIAGPGRGGAQPGQPPDVRGGGRAGGAAGGAIGGIRTVSPGGGRGGSIRVQQQGNFEPIKELNIEYPEVPDDGEAITLVGPKTTLDFLDTISVATNWNIISTQTANAIPLQFWINAKSPKDALEILKFHDIYYEFDEESRFLFVMTMEEYLDREYGEIVEEEFRVHYTDIADAEAIIAALLSPRGRFIVDPRLGQIFVYDIETNLDHMRKALDRLDVPLESRTIALTYVDAETLIDSIEALMSERGMLQVDSRLNTITVTDLPNRQLKIAGLIETLDQEIKTRTWALNYADPFEVQAIIAELVPPEMGSITVNETLHTVTVRAIPARLEEIDAQIKVFDRQRQQVQIEAYLVTMNTETSRELGIDWAYFETVGDSVVGLLRGGSTPNLNPPGSGQRLSIGQLPAAINRTRDVADLSTTPLTFSQEEVFPFTGGDNPILEGFSGDNLSAVLNYLETTGNATIHTHPRVTVQDGEEALFENITRVPFVTASETTANTLNAVIRNRIDFVDVGTILSVSPHVTEEKSIVLGLSAEESTFVFRTIVGNDQENTVPEKSQNRAETIVEVADGQTIVIGGLRTSNLSDMVDKVPFLGDLPLFGRLFRNTSKEQKHNDLMIFITPTVVNEMTHPEAERIARAEEKIIEEKRHEEKNAFRRSLSNITGREHEIIVSIGRSGDLYSRGEQRNMADLRNLFFEVDKEVPILKTVVIRRHPRADEGIEHAVRELAMEADLEVEVDDGFIPFVPHYRPPRDEGQ